VGTIKRVKQFDLGDPLTVELSYRNADLDITDTITVATPVVFIMTPRGETTPTIDRETATVVSADDATVTVRYSWQSGELDTVGEYNGEFEFTLSGGPATAPTRSYITIVVEDDLG
jgi:hypothetical protein